MSDHPSHPSHPSPDHQLDVAPITNVAEQSSPLSAAQKFYSIPQLRLRTFQCLRRKDILNIAIVNRESYGDAMKVLYHTMRYRKIYKKDRRSERGRICCDAVRCVTYDSPPLWPGLIEKDEVLRKEYSQQLRVDTGPIALSKYNQRAVEVLINDIIETCPNLHRIVYLSDKVLGTQERLSDRRRRLLGTNGDSWTVEIRNGKPIAIHIDSKLERITARPEDTFQSGGLTKIPSGPYGAKVTRSYQLHIQMRPSQGILPDGNAAIRDAWSDFLRQPAGLPAGLNSLELSGIMVFTEDLIRILQLQRDDPGTYQPLTRLVADTIDPIDLATFTRIINTAGPTLEVLALTRLEDPVAFATKDLDLLEDLLRVRLPKVTNLRICIRHDAAAEKRCLGTLEGRMAERSGHLDNLEVDLPDGVNPEYQINLIRRLHPFLSHKGQVRFRVTKGAPPFYMGYTRPIETEDFYRYLANHSRAEQTLLFTADLNRLGVEKMSQIQHLSWSPDGHLLPVRR